MPPNSRSSLSTPTDCRLVPHGAATAFSFSRERFIMSWKHLERFCSETGSTRSLECLRGRSHPTAMNNLTRILMALLLFCAPLLGADPAFSFAQDPGQQLERTC